jgi:colanic acid/amylovoran biosynthesis glycosyltransferase
MVPAEHRRVGYVVKRYPRYSETFIVNEILAHEAAGLKLDVFSLRPPCDTHFQDRIARVRAGVHYLPSEGPKGAALWAAIGEAAELLPDFWAALGSAKEEDAFTVYQALCLACEVPKRRISHLHAHFATEPTSVARLAARLAGVSYTFTAHAKDIFHEGTVREDRQRKVNDAAAVVTVSEFNRRFLEATYGGQGGKVRRIYNGLNLDEFAYAEPRQRPPTIVSVGRLIEKKGFVDLIEACALLAADAAPFRCQIIGSGEDEALLRERIRVRDLTGRVELLGPRPQAEVIQRVQAAAVFAAPCVVGQDGNRDGLPTVLLETMALGTPCISTDVTGIPEVVRHEETGLVVPQRDPAALAAALRALLTDAPRRVRLAAAARALIEREFDIDCNTAEMRALFSEAANATAAGGLLAEVA